MTSAPSLPATVSQRSLLGSLLFQRRRILALAVLLHTLMSSQFLPGASEAESATVSPTSISSDVTVRSAEIRTSSAAVCGPADSETPVANSLTSLRLHVSSDQIDHTPDAHVESVGSPILSADDHYWIVSSWKSPQQFEGRPRQFCPEVTCYKDGVGYQKSSISELHNALIPGIPICIVVHGSFMDHPSVRPESLATWRWLKSAGHPVQYIYFSWPSDRPITLAQIDVAILGNRASYNGFYLASLIKQLPAECPLSLVGHSHGTRLISSALHLMSGGEVEGISHPTARCSGRRIRTVFVASAIDHDWLNPDELFGRALICTESLINLRNHKDPALFIYPFRRIGSSRALGCTGFTKSDRSDLRGWSRKVRDLDVSSLIGARHMWPSYIRQHGLAKQLQNYLYFVDQPAAVISLPVPAVPAAPGHS